MFEGSVSQLIAVNTSQVDPNSFTSYWDALDPKYRGKIVAFIRRPGPGGGQSRFVWLTEGLGQPFLGKRPSDFTFLPVVGAPRLGALATDRWICA